MAKKKGSGGWWILFTAVGIGVLYYLQTGIEEHNSAGVPDPLEREIDSLITELNNRLGRDWVGLGLNTLTFYLQGALPPPLVDLLAVVVTVENESKRRALTSKQKQQLAIQLARNV